MLRKLLVKRLWLSVALAGAFLPATIVCEVPNIVIDVNNDDWDDDDWDDDDWDDDCCDDDGFFFDWWWF